MTLIHTRTKALDQCTRTHTGNFIDRVDVFDNQFFFLPQDQSVLARLEKIPPLLLLQSFLENATCILDDSHPLLGKTRLFLLQCYVILGLRLVVIDRIFLRCVVIDSLLVLLLWLQVIVPLPLRRCLAVYLSPFFDAKQ